MNKLNRRFDHAALKPEVDEAAVRTLCKEAIENDFYSVAINPVWVRTAADELKGSAVKILSVAGFPLSAARTDVKLFEAIKGVDDGAHEIDMVANVGWMVSDRFKEVETEIAEIRSKLPFNVVLKVIIEAGKLTTEQQIEATKCIINAGAQFVKTCTGFFGGATLEQIRTLHEAAAGQIEVKASGGIRTLEQCREFLAAGATRLGSSSSVAIMGELNAVL
ncbi:MAG: deoxyribose-phosphate aldolase [candidate division Zixibacteria bacterium]|nr:deoxyribose-phosphate aldolase [candidate division Zixibacteria bacterium]MDH3936004.1 deoxyribose-phosphate aldolase [candidate division Zixibacteria bacterium]MDH4033974.1 deoxyribose-phosphate aldolase [candidate division Zixibacteria bacterium]